VPTIEPADPRVQAAILAFATEFLLFTDQRGGLIASEGAGLAAAGFTVDPANAGRHIGERIHPDDLPAVLDLIERARIDPEFRDTIRTRARGDDGRWRIFEATVIGVARHPVLGTGAVIRARLDDAGVDEGEDLFASLAAVVPHGVLSGDVRGWVVFANDQARALFALAGTDILGDGWRRVIHADDLADVIEACRNVIIRGIPHQATFRTTNSEERRWISMRIVPLGPTGRRTGWIATLEDASDRFEVEVRLTHQATHDELTGLPNRALLEDRLSQACTRRRRDEHDVSALFLDLDGFKSINDHLGHHAGDEVLRIVADRLRQVTRPEDTLARLGGDEFVVVLDGLDAPAANEAARRIQMAVSQPAVVAGRRISVVASIGVATAGPRDVASDVLARADADMYARKRGYGERRMSRNRDWSP
jgi:diguanylate cyclase (GGDEF)-like protein/PAS domain S-box-containing protein